MFKWFKKESDVKGLEKELAAIANKINKHDAYVSSLRSTSRRYQGALTLYGVLSYVMYLMVWILIYMKDRSDTRKWFLHTLPIVLVPLVIYGLRRFLSEFYTRRIGNEETSLQSLRSTQKEKIEEFKAKTDFYSTKSLIDRYSGENPASSAPATPLKAKPAPNTGSILRDNAGSAGQSPRLSTQSSITPLKSTPRSLQGTIPTPSSLSGTINQSDVIQSHHTTEEFAPNAGPVHSGALTTHWYDRILDVIIGEDEANQHSRYQLEQKLRSRDEKISAMEVELMKLRQMTKSDSSDIGDEDKTSQSSGTSHKGQSTPTRRSARNGRDVKQDDP